MSRLEGYSTWDAVNNTIGVGPVQAPPSDSTATWYLTYIDFDSAHNGITHEIKAAFNADDSTILRSLGPRDYSGDNSMLMEWLRTMRNEMLAECDWTQVGDSALTTEKRGEWQMYRQQLRDLPDDYANITSADQVNFPTEPS